MKSYISSCREISADQLYDGLLGEGLFAEKIPQFLSSKDFVEYSKTIQLPGLNQSRDYIRFSSMRNINIPRPLAIPDPFIYASLCGELRSNWDKILKHFENQTRSDNHKVSRIHLRKLKDSQKLFEMNYKKYADDGDPYSDLIINCRFLAIADISKCFPSIYSHAIPWALVGKKLAKKNKTKQKTWYNKLDSRIRNVKFGETNGVLIGPHASNLLAEIILTKVDKKLSDKKFQFMRNIDDYTCFTYSFEEAEKFHLELASELEKYELSLNLKKSEIVSLPRASVKNWVNKLKHYPFVDTYNNSEGKESLKAKELQAFLDFATEVMLDENSDASIINYAIKVIGRKHLGKNALELYLKRIHHLTMLYPYLIQIMDEHVFKAHSVSKSFICKISQDLFIEGQKRKVYEPCSYALYWAMKYDFQLDIQDMHQKSLRSGDCIFMLSSFLYQKKHGNMHANAFVKKAIELKAVDFYRYWLFIYEVLSVEELSDEYKAMKRRGLSFVKPFFR